MRKFFTAFLLLISAACHKVEFPDEYTVGFACGDETRTSASADGTSTHWAAGDQMSLWAESSGKKVLSAQTFKLFASDCSRAWFSSVLGFEMPEASYTYRACYPVPQNVNGNILTFNIPDAQNGLASNGADIMISDAVLAGPLKKPGEMNLSLSFNHLLHLLRFYIPEGSNTLGEPVEKIVLTFPKNVNGTMLAELESAKASEYKLTGNTVTLTLSEKLSASAASDRAYAFASIAPSEFSADDILQAKLYTSSKVCNAAPIKLNGRKMEAGHTTAVALVPGEASTYCRMKIHIASNNLGEELDRITLKAPSGCTFPSSGTREMVLSNGGKIDAGSSFIIEFENEAAFRKFSKASLDVVYDSEHVTMNGTVKLPDLSKLTLADVNIDIPYLLFEDFSTVGTFSSNDEYKTSSAGSKSAYSFLNGWTGGRIGAQQGCCIRTACRRETSADYDSRVDSAPLNATLKKAANLSVSFDYGANNKYGGITIVTDGNVGQNCYVGYVTSTNAYSSGDTNGTFQDGNTFYIKEYTGSFTNTPNDCLYVLNNVPAGKTVRISIRTEIEHQAGTTNTTAWLYIDNLKVQISK